MRQQPFHFLQRAGLRASITAASIGAAAIIAIIGCAHAPARCDLRSPSSEQPPPGTTATGRDWYARRSTLLRLTTELYDQGQRAFRAADPHAGEGEPYFNNIVDWLRSLRGSEFMYERLADGRWGYRCDDLTKVYALAAYYYGLIWADHRRAVTDYKARAADYFCVALETRPDIVIPVGRSERLSSIARSLFESAVGDPACHAAEGWRTATASPSPPRTFSPQDLMAQ